MNLGLSLLLISLSWFGTVLPDSDSRLTDEVIEEDQVKLYNIEGSVEVEGTEPRSWAANTKIIVDGGKRTGHVNADGMFKIYNLPAGSYLVEVVSSSGHQQQERQDKSKEGQLT